jgi:uncharacterized protein
LPDQSAESHSKQYEALLGSVNSIVLKYGVIASCALISIGIVIALEKPSLQITVSQLIATNVGRPSLDLATVFSSILNLDGIYIAEIGVLMLLATPIVRVAVSTVVFAAEKDRTYVMIGMLVLLVLLVSIFVVGPFEAST